MTDREVLDLVLEKVTGLDDKVTGLESEMSTIKEDITELKSQMVELRDMDRMILSEVERVHDILDIHKEDKTVHIA